MDHEKNNSAEGADGFGSKMNRDNKLKIKSLSLRKTTLDFRKYTQRIWLAGLGAFSKVEEEGNDLFEVLVKMGEELESTTSQVFSHRLTPVEKSYENVDLGYKCKVEQLLDHRLNHALSYFSLATAQDLKFLETLVLQLHHKVDLLIEENQKLKMELKKIN